MFRKIEELSLNAWPAINTSIYDGWLIRLSNGYSNRSNAVIPLYKSSINLHDKIEYCEDIYIKNKLIPTFKLYDYDEFNDLDDILASKNYASLYETSVQIAEIKEIDLEGIDGLEINYGYSDRWANEYILSRDITHGETVKNMKLILKAIVDESVFITYRYKNSAIGFGYGVFSRGHIGLNNIYVLPECRGRGIGKIIINGIFREAQKNGIDKAFLQVMKDNGSAMRLYSKMGFKEEYTYWYRKKQGYQVT